MGVVTDAVLTSSPGNTDLRVKRAARISLASDVPLPILEAMNLPLIIPEKAAYQDHWAQNASHFEAQGCYSWMAEKLAECRPARILDIGCGTGEGLIALLRRFDCEIISLEENAACIKAAAANLERAGYEAQTVYRIGYQEFSDGTHDMILSHDPIAIRSRVTLIQAEMLFNDFVIDNLLRTLPTFDAVTIWLIGTYKIRQSCRGFNSLKIADSNEYRLRVQNRAYLLADSFLRRGGQLQTVDRTEEPSQSMIREDFLQAHRDQAEPTSLEVCSLEYLRYSEPPGKRVGMVLSPGRSGRIPDTITLVMTSVLARKC